MTKIDNTALYKPARKFIRFNVDDELIPVKVYLPEPPPVDMIDGYGLHPDEQEWKRPVIPKKLQDISKKIGVIDDIWDYINKHQYELKEEIDFIKRMWYYRLNGYWCFINGEPTYIPGKYHFFLSWYVMDSGKRPKFKDRQWMMYCIREFIENDTMDFENKSTSKGEEGMALPDEQGYYHMYDTGRRVHAGDAEPKFRRQGSTNIAQSDGIETVTKLVKSHFVIQGRTDEEGKKIFNKYTMPAFNELPFFFKPIYNTPTGGQTKITFDYVSDKSAVKGIFKKGLGSSIYYVTGKEKANDGSRISRLHTDEVGKDELNNTWLRHNINLKCLYEDGGEDIIGYNSNTSTCGDMLEGGGENFKILCDMSNYYRRSELGHTGSYLVRIFLPSRIGIKVDKFGHSDIEQNHKNIMSERSQLLSHNNLIGWNQQVRDFPESYSECFMTTSSSMDFNIYKIDQRLLQLKGKRKTRVGKFIDIDPGNIHSPVEFVDDPNGYFEISKELTDKLKNKRFRTNGTFYPGNGNMFTAGSDAFRMNNTETDVQSKGGGYVFWERDMEIDPDTKDREDWESYRTVCTYNHRPPTKEEYCYHMLQMCKYFGCFISCETNVDVVIDAFTKWGYGGFLLYYYDDKGYPRNTPGLHASANSEQTELGYVADYIEHHAHRECHADFLNQCKSMKTVKDLKKLDLLAAAGQAHYGSLRGCKSFIDYINPDKRDRYDISLIINPN